MKVTRSGSSWGVAARLTSALLLALLPKCPLCWAGYAALAASLGLQIETSYAWLLGALYVALGVGVLCLWRLPSRRGAGTATLGAFLIACGRSIDDGPAIADLGFALLLVGLVTSLWGRSLWGRSVSSRQDHEPEKAGAGADVSSCC